MIDVTVTDLQSDTGVDCEAAADFVTRVAEALACTADEVSVAFVDEKAIKEYNRTYRGKDTVTDVLSFGLDGVPGADGLHNLGDLVICVARAADQAEKAGHPLWTELRILLLHGFLHLLGRDHPELADGGEESEMEQEEGRLRQMLISENQ
jgi:rRNA maturation RNase YbeY